MGFYEVLAPLGAGGMGEVYRAKDARLGREIALKVLPIEAAGDALRRSRFEQEARAASARRPVWLARSLAPKHPARYARPHLVGRL